MEYRSKEFFFSFSFSRFVLKYQRDGTRADGEERLQVCIARKEFASSHMPVALADSDRHCVIVPSVEFADLLCYQGICWR